MALFWQIRCFESKTLMNFWDISKSHVNIILNFKQSMYEKIPIWWRHWFAWSRKKRTASRYCDCSIARHLISNKFSICCSVQSLEYHHIYSGWCIVNTWRAWMSQSTPPMFAHGTRNACKTSCFHMRCSTNMWGPGPFNYKCRSLYHCQLQTGLLQWTSCWHVWVKPWKVGRWPGLPCMTGNRCMLLRSHQTGS